MTKLHGLSKRNGFFEVISFKSEWNAAVLEAKGQTVLTTNICAHSAVTHEITSQRW